jgi:hypothetical protein
MSPLPVLDRMNNDDGNLVAGLIGFSLEKDYQYNDDESDNDESIFLIDEKEEEMPPARRPPQHHHRKVTPLPALDLAPIYAASRSRGIHSYSRSLSSINTDWSSVTARMSNTTTTKNRRHNNQHEHEHHQQKKRRFLQFAKVLMKLLERKDPMVYQNAQTVIQHCEEQKRRGETKSVTENLKAPLKQVVGYDYWHEARNELSQHRQQRQRQYLSNDCSDGFVVDRRRWGSNNAVVRDNTSSTTRVPRGRGVLLREEEVRLRKKRKWMIISVFMRYLEHNDIDLYLQAKAIVKDCLHRHRNQEEGYHSLSGSIQSALKQQIGSHHWRRAESYIHKCLVRKEHEHERRIDDEVGSTTLIDNTSMGSHHLDSRNSINSNDIRLSDLRDLRIDNDMIGNKRTGVPSSKSGENKRQRRKQTDGARIFVSPIVE